MSFERLAAFSDAFEQVIEQSGDYAPALRKIKVPSKLLPGVMYYNILYVCQDAYHEELTALLSEEPPSPTSKSIPAVPESVAPPTPDPQLIALRKEIHQMAIQYRVAAHRNSV